MIPSGWREVRLGDYATLKKGISYKGAFLNEDGPTLLGLGEFVPGGGAKLDNMRTYSGEYRDKHMAYPGDVLVAMTDLTQSGAVLGSPMIVPIAVGEFCLFTHHNGRLSPDEGLNPQFLYYMLTNPRFRDFAAALATGTTVRAVRPDDVLAYEFPLPPLDEQRAIARVLGALDDKIELNRRMSETLEAMARALFRSWFVDFEPVRARAEGRPTGLPPALAAHFPATLTPSPLGDIPQGWQVATLGDVFDLTMGQSPPGSTYNEEGEGLPFFQGRTDFGFRYPENRKFCTEPKRTAHAGDTLVSVRAPVGDMNMAWELSCVGRGVAALRHKSGSSSYTYYAIEALQPEIQQYEHTGTVFGAINKKQFAGLPIIEPPEAVVGEFHTRAQALDERIRHVTANARALAEQRDALLPRLVSGELRLGAGGP